MTGLGDHPFARGTPPSASTGHRDRVALGHRPPLRERFQVSAHSSWGQPQQSADRGRRDRAPLGHRRKDPRPGARLLLGMPFGRLDNHNASMS